MEEIERDNVIALTRHMSTQIAKREFKEKPIIPLKHRVPREFHDYLHVFSVEEAKLLPPR